MVLLIVQLTTAKTCQVVLSKRFIVSGDVAKRRTFTLSAAKKFLAYALETIQAARRLYNKVVKKTKGSGVKKKVCRGRDSGE